MSSNKNIISIDEAYQYCKSMTHRWGPHFSVGFRFLPLQKRNAIYAVYAFCRYTDDIVDENNVSFPERKIKEWEEELYRCYRQEPTHPISVALANAITHYPIPIEGFLGLLAGCRMDLFQNRYPTYEALLVYCDLVATTIRDLSLPVFGYSDSKAFQYGQALSTALQLTNIVRDIQEDLNRGRIYLPQDEIKACGYSEEELRTQVKNAAFLRLIQFQCNRIRELFQQSAPLLHCVDSDAVLALSLMRNVYITLVDKIERRPFDLFEYPIRLSWMERGQVVLKQFLHLA